MRFRKASDLKHLLLAVLALLLVPACLAQNRIPPGSEIAESVRWTVPPGAESSVAIKTLPNAECRLFQAGSNDTAHSLKIYADSEGILRFHTRPPNVAFELHHSILLQCQADGRVLSHPSSCEPPRCRRPTCPPSSHRSPPSSRRFGRH